MQLQFVFSVQPVTTGPGAFSSDPICHIVTSFSGNQTDTSAKFAGQVGAITVPICRSAAMGICASEGPTHDELDLHATAAANLDRLSGYGQPEPDERTRPMRREIGNRVS